MKVTVAKENNNRRPSRVFTRFFKKIGDFYVKMMSDWANQMDSTGVGVTTLPKSFSMSSSRVNNRDQDLAELVRIASRRGLSERVQTEFLRRQGMRGGSVRMEKIHEDESDFKSNIARSRSVMF
ncbi:hypothetical protein LXL04_000275 [Taraxacum kok-saghyz]